MKNANEENLLLASMARDDWTLLDAHLKLVDLTQGQILFDRGEDVVRSYFPSMGTIISLMMPLKNGSVVEVTMIGYEGAAGGIVSAGNKPASARMQVLCGGTAWCIPTSVLEEIKWRSKIFITSSVDMAIFCSPRPCNPSRVTLTTRSKSDAVDGFYRCRIRRAAVISM